MTVDDDECTTCGLLCGAHNSGCPLERGDEPSHIEAGVVSPEGIREVIANPAYEPDLDGGYGYGFAR